MLEHILGGSHAGQNAVDSAVEKVVAAVLNFKAVTIFSFLFGSGIAIQAERAAGRGFGVSTFLARRLAWLFLFGVVHLLLIWNGDILALYAICGLLLLPVLRLPRRALFVLGALAIALPEIVPLRLALPAGEAAAVQIAQAREIYGGSDFLRILNFASRDMVADCAAALGILPRTVGLMCGAWRWEERRAAEARTAQTDALDCVRRRSGGDRSEGRVAIYPVLAYVSGLLLLLPRFRSTSLRGVAP
ncbi:MAG: hypothetical protein WKF37_21310 [Bryobacteraceae bacterium]